MSFLPATTLCQGPHSKESPGTWQAPPVDQVPLTSLYLWVLERPNLTEKPGWSGQCFVSYSLIKHPARLSSVYLLRTFHINGNMQYVTFASVLFFTQHNDFEVYPSYCMCQVTQCKLWLGDETASLLAACTGPRCDIDKSHILRSGHWTRSSGFNINWGSV